ncbi:MAG TPA: hypothetical protein QF851_01720 [Flavobacteriales bacterium]|mgnify:CR=1 FL=1|nr:hypothetical protein [Flavobacteriales bacterium]
MNEETKAQLNQLLNDKSMEEVSAITDYIIAYHNNKLTIQQQSHKRQFSVGDEVIVSSQKAGGDFEGVIEKIMPKNIRVKRHDIIQTWDVSPTMVRKVS